MRHLYNRFPFMFSECLGFPTIQHGSNLISLSEELFMDTDGKYHQYSTNYPYNSISSRNFPSNLHIWKLNDKADLLELSNQIKHWKNILLFFFAVKVEANNRLRNIKGKPRGFSKNSFYKNFQINKLFHKQRETL